MAITYSTDPEKALPWVKVKDGYLDPNLFVNGFINMQNALFILLLCFGAFFSMQAQARCTHLTSLQSGYDRADAVALVRTIGEMNGSDEVELEVIRSWKLELPKIIRTRPTAEDHSVTSIPRRYHFNKNGRYILYLSVYEYLSMHDYERGKPSLIRDGGVYTDECSWNLHESERAFNSRLRELEKATECGCKGYEAQGFDPKYLADRADIVVEAIVTNVGKEGAKSYAALQPLSFVKPYLPLQNMDSTHLTILTDDGSGCGYPITIGDDPNDTTDYGYHHHRVPRDFYRIYLNYDPKEEIYSTNLCSGNVHGMHVPWER